MKRKIVLIASLLSLVATVSFVEAGRADAGPTPVVTIDDYPDDPLPPATTVKALPDGDDDGG